MMKKFIQGTLFMAITFGIISCGNQSKNEDSSDNESGEATELLENPLMPIFWHLWFITT